jgi:tetratricopeptide (TPR) repeat protein
VGAAQPAALAVRPQQEVAWPARSGVMPPRADAFATRVDTVPGVEAMLVPGTALVLVSGEDEPRPGRAWPGSAGKTQLASWLADSLWRSQDVDFLAWVTAASRASVLSGYVQAAAQLGLDDGGDAQVVAARFLAWLGGTARPWLVVLDDLRDAADLDGLWPGGPAGRVLITAVDAAEAADGQRAVVVPVPAFSPREAMAYLFDRLATDPEQRSGAYDLAADLGGEPAALAQATAVMTSSGTGCREYQHRFLRQRARLMAAPRREPPAAMTTWTLSADYAEEMLPGGGTWPLLVLAALLDSHGIPQAALTAPAACRYLAGQGPESPADPGRAWAAALALEDAGLVATSPASDPHLVWVSASVQSAVRAAAPAELISRAARAAADALVEAWPKEQPGSVLAGQMRSCAASLLHHAGDALWAGGNCHRVLLAAGHSLTSARLAGPAASWWRDVAAGCERLLGAEHPDTLVAAGQMADALLAAGQAPDAAHYSRWVLTARAKMLGPDHPGTLAAMASLGRALVAAGEAADAVIVLKDAAIRSERASGPDDPGTVATLEEYAAARLAAGDAAGAVRSCGQALAGRERLHGPVHPGTVAARLRLAGACLAAGKAREAISQHKRAVETLERVLGPDHLDTLAARASLAAAQDAAGQIGSALQEHQRACAGYERALGADHPATLARLADLARAYGAAGQLGDAVGLLRDSIARSEQALPAGDPVTRLLRQALADITADMAAG